jgi:hypothetical protein
MSCLPFLEQAALKLAPSFRERYDFSSDEQYKLWADQTWKAAKALTDGRPIEAPKVKEAAK